MGQFATGRALSMPLHNLRFQLIDLGVQLYFNLMGQVPPAGYIEGLVRSGMGTTEIEMEIRSKPAFPFTAAGKRAKADVEGQVARDLGVF